MNKGLTNTTRAVVYLMGIAVTAICFILLPELAREEAVGKTNPPSALPFLLGAWAISVPIYIALRQTLTLLSHIDRNTAFSKSSVNTLQIIKYCTIAFSVLITLGAVAVIAVAKYNDPNEDVTFVVPFWFVFTFVSGVITTFIAVLQRLLQEAIDMKSENDLTV